jgi:hypothetical protein
MTHTNNPGQIDPRQEKKRRIALFCIAAIIIAWSCQFTWRHWNTWQAPMTNKEDSAGKTNYVPLVRPQGQSIFRTYEQNEALWTLIPERFKDKSSIVEWRGKIVACRPKGGWWQVYDRLAVDSIIADMKKHLARKRLKERDSL